MALLLAARVGFLMEREKRAPTELKVEGKRDWEWKREREIEREAKRERKPSARCLCTQIGKQFQSNTSTWKRYVCLSIVRQTRLTLLQRIIDQLRQRKKERERQRERRGKEKIEGVSEKAQRTRAWFRAP